MIYLPETNKYLRMGHKSYNLDPKSGKHGTSHHLQFFFTLSGEANYDITRVSPMFCFGSKGREGDCDAIQFVGNLEVVEEKEEENEGQRATTTLLLPYGVNDAESYLYSMSLDEALDMLCEVDASSSTSVEDDAITRTETLSEA